jgi:hypothetical protein
MSITEYNDGIINEKHDAQKWTDDKEFKLTTLCHLNKY